jgi:hypothetical protein
VELPGSFDEVVRKFEQLVPSLDVEQLAGVLHSGGGWRDVESWTQESAPRGFLRYWKNDVRPLMGVAGNRWQAIAYLMGNHVTAEHMFRYEPRVMNYAPLRVALTRRDQEPVLFTADVPSDDFGAFGSAEIAAVGASLDAELSSLLLLLGSGPVDALSPTV